MPGNTDAHTGMRRNALGDRKIFILSSAELDRGAGTPPDAADRVLRRRDCLSKKRDDRHHAAGGTPARKRTEGLQSLYQRRRACFLPVFDLDRIQNVYSGKGTAVSGAASSQRAVLCGNSVLWRYDCFFCS